MGKDAKISTGIELDGEKEFKQTISDINKDLSVLASEMKMVTSEFADNENSVDALKRKNEILCNQYDTQKDKIEATANALQNSQKLYERSGEKVEELKLKLQAAKDKMQDMENSSKSTSEELERQQKEIDAVSQDLEKAETAYGRNETKLKDWQIKLNNATTELNKLGTEIDRNKRSMEEAEQSTEDASEATKDFSKEVGKAKESTISFSDIVKANLVSQAIIEGISGMVSMIGNMATSIMDFSVSGKQAMDDFATKTGTAKSELGEFEDVMHDLYSDNYGQSLRDVADVMAVIKQNTNDIDPSGMESYAKNAILMRDTFGYETQESVRTVNMMVEQFGITSEEAFDLIAQGAQKGLDKNDDLLDTINEYSVHFEQLGYDAEDMFNALKNGADNGTFSVDKLGDAVKEFGIRVKDGTADSAFEELGLDVEATKEAFVAGGDAAQQAMETVTTRLYSMNDKVEQNTLGVTMFGTMWEDLGVQGIKALSDINGEIRTTTDAMDQINSIRYDDLYSAVEGISRQLQDKFCRPFEDAMINAQGSINTFSQELDSGELGESIEKIGSSLGELANDFIDFASDAIPMVTKGLSWILDNKDLLISGLGGIGAAMLTIKVGDGIDNAIDKFKDLSDKVSGAGGVLSLINTSLAANPWTAVAIGVGALATGIMLYASGASDAKDETEQLIEESQSLGEEMQELNDEVGELKEAREKETDSIVTQYESYRILADRLYTLSEKENLTNTEKRTMVSLVEDLNEALPGLNLQIDEQTGLLSKQKDEVYQLIDANQNLYLAKALEDNYAEIAQKQADATLKKIEAEEKLNDLKERQKVLQEELDALYADSSSLDNWEVKVIEHEDALNDLGITIDDLEKNIKTNNDTIEECSSEWELNQKAIEECSDTMGTAEDSLNSLEGTASSTSDSMVQSAQETTEAYEESIDARAEEIESAIGLFDEFEKASDISGKKLMDNLKSQVKGMSEWADNLKELAKKGIDEGLLKELQEMGPSAAAEIQALNSMSDSELQEYVKLWKDKSRIAKEAAVNEAGEMKDELIDKTKEATDGMVGEMDKSAKKATNSMEKVKTGVDIGLEGLDLIVKNKVEGAKTAAGQVKFNTVGKEIVTGINTGIGNNASLINRSLVELAQGALNAAKKELQIQSPSKKFQNEVGAMIAEGTAEGIKKNKKKATDAASDMSSSVLDKAKKWMEKYSVYHEVTLTDEVFFWERLRKEYKKGTDERLEIDKNYYEKKRELYEKLKEAEQEYKDKCKEVNSNLKADIKELNQAYLEAVQTRSDAIVNSMNLFEQFSANTEQTGEQLLSNLQTQVEGLNAWRETLGSMKEKISDINLFEYLQNLGPDALGELQALNQLTEEQLNQYVSLWQEKNTIANDQATTELTGLKSETSEKINKLVENAQKEIAEYTKAYKETIEELGQEVELPLEKITVLVTDTGKKSVKGLTNAIATEIKTKESKEKIKTVNDTVEATVSKLSDGLYIRGQNAVHGLISGINSKMEELRRTIKEMCDLVSSTADTKLEIHSPSRVFYRKGAFAAQGLELGFTDTMQDVTSSISNSLAFNLQDAVPDFRISGNTDLNMQEMRMASSRSDMPVNQYFNFYSQTESASEISRRFKQAQKEAMLRL